MFESDIERSKIRLLELVNSTQPTVYLNDILGRASIDYAYKQYFEAEFGWWLYEEQTLRQANPNLDLNDPSTVGILNNLDTQYRKHARFDREQLMLIIDSAVKCVLNYRVRPRTTLKWFVFRGEPTKPIYEVYLRMRYFADYRYLHEGFNQWLLKRGLRYDSLDIISVLEFERLIKKIDDDTILELSPSQFVELIAPISYFFAELSVDPTKQSIPIEAVIIFLDDKEVYIIAQKLERMLYQQGIQQLTKEMFLSVVDEVLREIEAEQGNDDLDGSENEQLKEDTSAVEVHSPTATPRPSAADLLRPTGTAASESIITAGLGNSTGTGGTEGAAMNMNQPSESRNADAASSVSVIQALSRRSDAEHTESDEITDQNFSQGETNDAHELEGTKPASDPSSLFVKQGTQEEYSTPSSSAFVLQKEESTVPGPSESSVDSQADIVLLQDELSSQIGRDIQAQEERHESQAIVQSQDSLPQTEQLEHTDSLPSDVKNSEENADADIASEVEAASIQDSAIEAEANSLVIDSNSPPTLGIISRALGNDSINVAERVAPAPYFEQSSRVHMDENQGATEAKVFPSITSFYDDRQRDTYIKKLCSKDAERFDDLVASIDQTRNWKEALAFLDKFYSQESVDPQSSVARDFRMAVYKRFIAL